MKHIHYEQSYMSSTHLTNSSPDFKPKQQHNQTPVDGVAGQSSLITEKDSPQDRITEKVRASQDETPQSRIAAQLKGITNHTTPQGKITTQLSEMKDQSTQGKLTTQLQGIQSNPNNTGMPDKLKSGVESLSGYAMDDVKVHYNSQKPAQLQAHAYAQGTDIHLGPGQEKHLPHEAWHVVQQKQGRVQPTIQAKGRPINDDPKLEKEADEMGELAQKKQLGTAGAPLPPDEITPNNILQGRFQPALLSGSNINLPIQRVTISEALSPQELGKWMAGKTLRGVTDVSSKAGTTFLISFLKRQSNNI